MLFLDLDGTILDDHVRHYATYVELLGQNDLRGTPIPEKEYWSLRRQNKPYDDILRMSRLFPTKFKTFQERFDQRLESPEMLALDVIRPGTETALGKLYTKTPIALITTRRDATNLESQLATLKMRKYFAEVLSGAPDPKQKANKDYRW